MEPAESKLDASPLPFLHLIQKLKHTPRTGWLRTIENPESVASHSFRVAMLGLFAPPRLNMMDCMFIGLCHDLGESVIGDIPTYANVPKEIKHQREFHAIQYVASLLRPFNADVADKVLNAWLDYEQGRTAEGQFMREMDKLECLVQAHEYEQATYGEKDLKEFQGLASKITSPTAKQWLGLLQEERRDHLAGRELRLPVILVAGDLSIPEAQCNNLTADLGARHIFVRDVLRTKAEDKSYPHAGILEDHLKQGIDVPTDLVMKLVKGEIETGKQTGSWCLVHGFPRNAGQLRQFERHVQIRNHILLLRSADGRAQYGEENTGESGWKNTDDADFMQNLPLGTIVKEIICDASADNADRMYGQVKSAILQLMKDASPLKEESGKRMEAREGSGGREDGHPGEI